MDLQSDFVINSPEKVYSKLCVLLKNKNLLTAGFGSNFFVTTLLHIDREKNVFICDGCEEDKLEGVLRCAKIVFKTEHLGATVAFESNKLTKTSYRGEPAFTVPIPSVLRWMEQREFFRVKIPAASPSHCIIPFPDIEPVKLKLYDISIRGFSMLITDEEISGLFIPGANHDRCKLMLENLKEMPISFEIRSKFIINPNNLNKVEKIGCKFNRITVSFENSVHGYMMEIEREFLKNRAQSTSYLKL